MRLLRHLALAGAAAAVLVGGGACGKADANPGVATAGGGQSNAAPSGAPERGDFQKFTQCMRDHGVDVPDPDPDTGRPQFGALAGADRDALQKAMEACRTLLPNGGVRPTLDAAQVEQLRVFAQCMRDNGVDMPDPDPNGGGFGLGAGGGAGRNPQLDRNNPTFQKAFEACQSKLPQVRGGRGGPNS